MLALKDVARRVGAQTHIHPTNLELQAGGFNILLGTTLAGKTSLLQIMAGLTQPSAGRVWFDGRDVTGVAVQKRNVAMVFQQFINYPNLSVYENIASPLRVARTADAEVRRRVGHVAELLGLSPLLARRPAELSGGQQQRTALARALVIRPKVLLFDEPLSNLDAQLRVRMRTEIRSVQRQLGITSVYVTHDQEEAFSISDRVAIMNKGRLVQLGTPRELYRQPADRFVAEFVGLSNIVSAELAESNAEGATVRVFGSTIRSRRPPNDADRPVSLVLRPEALRIGAQEDGGVPAHVLTLAFLGPLARYTVAVQDGTVLTVDLHNPGPEQFFPEGTAVSLRLPSEVPALLNDAA